MDPTANVRFTRLYEAYYADVLAYRAHRVNRADAEDVANVVFTVLWSKLDGFDEESTIAWLYGVAVWRGCMAWPIERSTIGGAATHVASA